MPALSVATLGRAGDRLLDLAFPPSCAGCGVEGDAICASCLPELYPRRGVPGGVPIGLPSDVPSPLLQLEWCAPFTGTVRRALHALKYAGERRLAVPLGEALAARWREAGAGGDLLVPVPVHADRARQRGFDQAVLVATVAGPLLDLPVVQALERGRATIAQYHLDRNERAGNVSGAFRLRPPYASAPLPFRGSWPILVDDVVTTGATLAACAFVLMEAGAIGVSAVTVARER